jgi:hypothetical protein
MAYDPARVFLYPALNLMFIRRDLKQNPDQYVFMLTDEMLFGLGPNSISRKKLKEIYPSFDLAVFYGRVSFAFTQKDVKKILTKNPKAQIIYPGQTPKGLPTQDQYPITSGSGELELHWKESFFLAKGGRTKLAMGYFGKKGTRELNDGIAVNITNSDYGCIAITSLTDKNITNSDHLMITTIANIELKGMFYDSNWKNPIAPSHDVVAQPLKGFVTLPGTMKNPVATWRTTDNKAGGEIQLKRENGKLILPLNNNAFIYEIKERQEAKGN